MAGLHKGEVVRRPPRLGASVQQGHNRVSSSAKAERGTGTQACVARGQEPPGTLQEASDREEVGHSVHRSSLWLRTRLLCRQGPLIMRTDVALRPSTGPLNPEPSLTRTETLLSLADTRVPEQRMWHLCAPPAHPPPASTRLGGLPWWACLYHLPLPSRPHCHQYNH